jgi:DNA-binding MarR family transcriptional regulator
MKATEIKYLFLLAALRCEPSSTHAALAEALDIPPSLVNRYIKRLASWNAMEISDGERRRYDLTPKGEGLLAHASWAFLALGAGPMEQLRERAVAELRPHAQKKAVLYGATPVGRIIGRWAADAGLDVVAVCDEERRGRNVARLDDLETLEYDVIILADWLRADDGMLARLLNEYGTVINLFKTDGAPMPEWR